MDGYFPSAGDNMRRILGSPSYLRAYEDIALLHRLELRPIRLQLEALKAELVQDEENIVSTVVLFGSARTQPPAEARERLNVAERSLAAAAPDAVDRAALEHEARVARKGVGLAGYYEEARRFGRIVSAAGQGVGSERECVIVTGGGPGMMEAGNRGAWDVGAKSIGMNITLPHEQVPNAYISPELVFQFHYFAIRKMHLLLRAEAAVFFPGGFGTMDELFETLTLVQCGKMPRIPIVLFGKEWWQSAVKFEHLVESGTISPEDVDLMHYSETAEDAWEHICRTNGREHMLPAVDPHGPS